MTRKQAPSERAPAFQFYWKQWLSDDNVLAMGWEARGMHMHFICLAWQQTPPCTLPNDDELMQAWVGFPRDWESIKKQITRAWRLDEATDRWVQDGLLRVWKDQKAYRDSRRKNAKGRSAKPSSRAASTSPAHAPHMGESPSPSPSPVTTKTTTSRKTAAGSENGEHKPPPPRETWLSPVCAVWEAKNGGGSFNSVAGIAAKVLAPLRAEGIAMEDVAANLTTYLERTDPQFANLPRFAQTFRQWGPKVLVDKNGIPTSAGAAILEDR